MNRRALVFVCLAAVMSGCNPDLQDIFGTSTGPGTGAAGGEGGAGAATASTGGSQGGGGATGGTTTTTTPSTGGAGGDCDPSNPNGDQDGDGYTPAQGDCDDCAAEINPNALEIPGGGDENCNGMTNDSLVPCDEPIVVDTLSPVEAAAAMDICKVSKGEKDWGISGAVWSLPDGSPIPPNAEQAFHIGHGVLPDFGPQVPPRAGKRVLAISSGTARTPEDPGHQSIQGYSKGYTSAPAPGFPKETSSCGGAVTGTPNDATALNLALRVPSNVHGFSYDFSFYAADFPSFVCTAYNDTFFALFEPLIPGQPDKNIAYDEMGNPITLNGAHFRACACDGGPCMAGNKTYPCPLGDLPLLGTGFDAASSGSDRGATGWLTTTVPVEPGSNLSLRWGVYDAGDASYDSTVIMDNWKWITEPDVAYGTKISQ